MLDVDDLIRRYRAGESLKELAATLPASAETIRRRLSDRGELLSPADAARRYRQRPEAEQQLLKARRASNVVTRRDDIDAAALASAYVAGQSPRQIGRLFGCCTQTVVRILTDAGVELRDKSSAGKLRASLETPEKKASRAARVSVTLQGRTHGQARSAAKASGKHRNMSQRVGRGEEHLLAALRDTGLETEHQFPVGVYNLDLAVEGGIAVEVHTMKHGPHLDRQSARIHRRVDYLTNAGWNVLYVWCPRGISPDDTDQVVAQVQSMRGKPPVPGQYIVFRCHGNHAPRRGGDTYKGAFVVTTSSVRDA